LTHFCYNLIISLQLIIIRKDFTEFSLITFLHMMRNLGMEEALQEFGVQDGDTVKIADVEFEYFE